MPKKRINLTVDEDLFREAKEKGINISSFLEIKLREYLALIEGMGSEVFEPSTSASSRRRHNHLDYEPLISKIEYNKLFLILITFLYIDYFC